MEALVARLYKNFSGSLCDILVGGPFNREKHLEKFYKNLVSKVFGDLSWRLVRDSVKSRKPRVLRFLDSF